VYIELVKPVMSAADASIGAKRAMQDALYIALEHGLRLLHPFMPFVTEELWQRLPRLPGLTDGPPPVTIMLAPYPRAMPAWADASAEADLELMMAVVKAARALRATYGLVPKARPAVCVLARTPAAAAALAGAAMEAGALAGAEAVQVVQAEADVPPGCALEVVSDAVSVYLSLKGAVDARAEAEKLAKKVALLAKSLGNLEVQAAAEDYAVKVPERVRGENAEKMGRLRAEISAAERGIADFEAML